MPTSKLLRPDEIFYLRRQVEKTVIDPFYTVITLQQLADRYQLHEQRIRRWLKAGKMPEPMPAPPKIARWPVKEILAWEDEILWGKTREEVATDANV